MTVYPLALTVANPCFETGTAPGTGWVTVNGTPGFGAANPLPDPRGGGRYLIVSTGGGAGTYRVRQDIAIPAAVQTDVDAGALSASLRCLWANFAAGNDTGFVELAFLDGGGAVISTATSPSFADAPKTWVAQAFTSAIPAGTRTLRLILAGTDVTGAAIDSYFDAVEAELVPTTPPAAVVTQGYGELVAATASAVRVSQLYTESLAAAASSARVGQLYAELIRSVADKPATAVGGTVVCIVAG